jgi:hypothetical protein
MKTVNPTANYANRNFKDMRMPPRPGLPKPTALDAESQTKKHVDSKCPPCFKGGDPETRPDEPNSGWCDPNY